MPNRNAQSANPPQPVDAPLSCPNCKSTDFVVFLTSGYGIVRRCESCSHVWPTVDRD